MSHTPGPWFLSNPDSPQDSSILGADKKLVVAGECDGWMVPFDVRGDIEGAANARLIAAAPELLEVLESLLVDTEAGMTPNWDRAQQVVKKARGE